MNLSERRELIISIIGIILDEINHGDDADYGSISTDLEELSTLVDEEYFAWVERQRLAGVSGF